jgi:hypothetical protein
MSRSPWIDASLEQQAILDQVQVRLVERTELESFKQLLKLLGESGLVANLGIQAGSVSSRRSIGFNDAIAKHPNIEGPADSVDEC